MYCASKPLLVLFLVVLATACRKEVSADLQNDKSADQTLIAPALTANTSKVVLLAGNKKNMAVDFSWSAFQPQNNCVEQYTIEADIAGAQFSDALELGNTSAKSISFTVAELNSQLRKISIPGSLARFEFRVRLNRTNAAPVYSSPIAMEASTFDEYREFESNAIFRLPGNYQDWQVELAPKAVCVNGDGEYEGYVNMSAPRPMFVLVKSATNWDYNKMYFDIGDSKFGFGSYIFLLPSDGVYKVNLSTNTNKWTCTKIDHFSVFGSATNQSDLGMEYDSNSQEWAAIVNLNAGDFNFRANGSDKIRLGSNNAGQPGALKANGENIRVRTAGKYKLVLSLINAGNYSYGLQRIP